MTTAAPAGGAPGSAGYGGFLIGAMQLALPLDSLREVVRSQELHALPCRSPAVLGGLSLRGTSIPVIDLRLLLGHEPREFAYPCIVVMAHAGRMIGLLAERVTGIFAARPHSFRRFEVASGAAASGAVDVVAGSVVRENGETLTTVLSPEALTTLDGVPMAQDGEPQEDCTRGGAGGEFAIRMLPLMLLRCRRIAMAVDAMVVHSTLADPTITASSLTRGPCRGTIEYTGLRIPAVDLLDLCGIGRLESSVAVHAFVVKFAQGFVAFLIDEVIDVVRVQADQIVPLAAYALPEPELFAGALPAAKVKPVFTAAAGREGFATSQYLLLDTARLGSFALIAALAATNVRAGNPALASVATASSLGRMVTFEADGEAAAPLEQIVEILAYDTETEIFANDGALVGLMVNRGRSIPLFCLRRLSGRPAARVAHDSRVLVVECAGEWVGFVVRRVQSIEPSYWQPNLPAHLGGEGRVAARATRLVQVGIGHAKRMLRLMDLEELARTLHADPSSTGQPAATARRAAIAG